MKKLFRIKFVIFVIIILGAFFRFYNINWDQGQHLHPDERFLTMVATAMVLPSTFGDYMNPQLSTMNPANIGHPFYVYGIFPVIITKIVAIDIGADNYADITLLGRFLSGFADLLIIFILFKTVGLLEKRHRLHANIKYWAAFFYAIAVLPIQLSHFFAVDTFLNLFIFLSFYYALRYAYEKNILLIGASAVCFALAIASKISALYAAPLILFFLYKDFLAIKERQKITRYLPTLLSIAIVFGITTYVVGRIGNPYIFQTNNFLNPQISSLFLDNIAALKSWSTPEAWFPPSVQWIHKTPILFPLSNLVLIGIGIGYTVFVGVGIVQTVYRYKKTELLAILAWMLLFFVYQGIQFSTNMRYFLPLYPFLAIFAAIGFYECTKHWSKIAKAAVLFPVFIWTLFFFSIYTQDHSRNKASTWIYTTIPSGSILLSEHWDDSLPLSVNPPSQKVYSFEQLPVFDPDTSEKWQKMNALLASGDYLVLSSNRGWGSIPTVPERYPQMTDFYAKLLNDETPYKKVAEFTSYPSLSYLGIPITIPDDWAEEAFTVYDHPKVMIFKNTAK